MVNKVERQIVFDHLQALYVGYKTDKVSINDRYSQLKKYKVTTNTTVLCLNCLLLRHRKDKKLCCEEAPKYDLTTSYRLILNIIQGITIK